MFGFPQSFRWTLDSSEGVFELQMMQQAPETGTGLDLNSLKQTVAIDRCSWVEQRILRVAPAPQPDHLLGHGQLQSQGWEILFKLLMQPQPIAFP